MPKTSLLAKSLAKLLEHQAGSERYVDVCISLRVHETDEELIRVGGRWDRKAKRYVGDAGQVRVLHVHKGQLRAARWFAEWLRRRATGDWKGFRRVWSALFVGGRRGGKSRLAVWAVCLFAVMKSGSESWCISPTQEETEELEKAIRETLPGPWFRYRGDPKWEYRIANGSVIRMLSGHKPSTLKRGRVDFALYNEGQLMSQKGYVQLRGATADSGGLTIIAANPPDTPIGRWIEDLYEKARAANDNLATAPANDNLVKVAAFEFDPADNPFIEYQSLLDLAAEVDEHTFLREVRGVFVPIGDVVLYAWSDSETIRDVPAGFEDVTEAFTRQHLGRAFKHVVGVDFQRTPHMAAVVLKIYVDPADPERAPLLWAVDEFVLSDADEDDVINALEAPGLGVRCPCCADTAEAYLPAECAVIADASGEGEGLVRLVPEARVAPHLPARRPDEEEPRDHRAREGRQRAAEVVQRPPALLQLPPQRAHEPLEQALGEPERRAVPQERPRSRLRRVDLPVLAVLPAPPGRVARDQGRRQAGPRADGRVERG